MPKKTTWTEEEDSIVQEWDHCDGSITNNWQSGVKTASPRLCVLALLLDHTTNAGTYGRMLHLRKTPVERLRLVEVHQRENTKNNTKKALATVEAQAALKLPGVTIR